MSNGIRGVSTIKSSIQKYGSKFVFSIGLGGFLSLYVIEFFRVKILPQITSLEKIHEVLKKNNIHNINTIEISIFIISIIALISAPLLSKNESKKSYEVMVLICVVFFEVIGILSIIVSNQISNLFIFTTMILFSYFVWLAIDILKIVYSWAKINKNTDQQVDVAKLTFIWAVLVFLLGLLK